MSPAILLLLSHEHRELWMFNVTFLMPRHEKRKKRIQGEKEWKSSLSGTARAPDKALRLLPPPGPPFPPTGLGLTKIRNIVQIKTWLIRQQPANSQWHFCAPFDRFHRETRLDSTDQV